jgi:type II secretory pathway pseudopilin PulG
MVVVLAIMGLIAVAAAQTIGRRPAGLVRSEAQARIEAAIQGARRTAARTGAAQAVETASILPGASLAGALPASGTASASAGTILVYPDGSSNGGIISVDGRPLAAVDWLTGEVRDAS